MTTIDRAAKAVYDTLSGKYGDFCHHEEVAQDLADAGLLTPEPQIIRTSDELAALDPDTLLATHGLVAALPLEIMWHLDSPPESVLSHDDLLPAVVIATGDTVRASRQALEDTDAVD